MNILAWLITPAATATVIFGVVPLFDAPVRWTRRLKNDIVIAGGVPNGEEKQLLQDSIETQARRLRLYRDAWSPGRLAGKWLQLALCSIPIVLLIISPPINRPGEKYSLGPTDYLSIGLGLYVTGIYIACIGLGLSVAGRTPTQMLIRDRIARYERRRRKLLRIERTRGRLEAIDGRVRKGSRLGFRTQSDLMAGWVRSWEARSIGTNTGWIASGISRHAYESLWSQGRRTPSTIDLFPRLD